MSSIATRRHINTYVEILKGRYQEPSVVITKIPNKKNDHFVRPNMVVLKYLDFKKKCWPTCSCHNIQFCNEGQCRNFRRVYHQCIQLYVKRYNIGLMP